jgi:hypothetical protein
MFQGDCNINTDGEFNNNEHIKQAQHLGMKTEPILPED